MFIQQPAISPAPPRSAFLEPTPQACFSYLSFTPPVLLEPTPSPRTPRVRPLSHPLCHPYSPPLPFPSLRSLLSDTSIADPPRFCRPPPPTSSPVQCLFPPPSHPHPNHPVLPADHPPCFPAVLPVPSPLISPYLCPLYLLPPLPLHLFLRILIYPLFSTPLIVRRLHPVNHTSVSAQRPIPLDDFPLCKRGLTHRNSFISSLRVSKAVTIRATSGNF